jgi:hypothetical protein
MAKYLATFNDTLGDIEITGFIIMTDREVDHFEELAASINWAFDFKLGSPDSNEELPFSSGEDLLSRIDFREISAEESKMFKKIFNNSFGVFIGEEFLTKVIGDETGESPELDEDDESVYED